MACLDRLLLCVSQFLRSESHEPSTIDDGDSGEKIVLTASTGRSKSLLQNIRKLGSEGTNAFGISHRYSGVRDGRILGKGMTATVRVVTDFETDTEWACKVMSLRGMDNLTLKNLRAELDVLRELDHPNVIRCEDVFEENQELFIITELCSGGELFERIADRLGLGLDEEETKHYMLQMLSGLSHCHHKNILHGDLKPENFVFASNDEQAELKLIDFGLSKEIKPDCGAVEKFGTTPYMSPETLEHGQRTKASDLWSMGVIMYQLLAGSLPFDADTPDAERRRIIAARVRFPKGVWETVSIEAKRLVQKLLSKEQSDRPTAKQAVKDPWLDVVVRQTLEQGLRHTDDDVLMRIHSYRQYSGMKQLAMLIIALNAPSPEFAELRKIFKSLDTNHDGSIQFEEFFDAINLLDSDTRIAAGLEDDADLLETFKEMDQDGANEIGFTEFVAATMKHRFISQGLVEEAFSLLDVDGSGFIERSDLERVLRATEFNEKQLEKIIDEAMSGVDQLDDDASTISHEEFCALFGHTREDRAIN